MSIDIRQSDGFDLVGDQNSTRNPTATAGFIPVSMNYNVPAADTSIFQADRAYIVRGIRGTPDVAGTGGACTATIRKVPSGTAITSGTALHSSTYNLVGSVNTSQVLTLSTTTSDLLLKAGDRIAVDFTGTATSAVGSITVNLSPA